MNRERVVVAVLLKCKEFTGAPVWVRSPAGWFPAICCPPAARCASLSAGNGRVRYVQTQSYNTPSLTRFHLRLSCCCSSLWRGLWTGVLTWVRSLGLLPVSAAREGHTPLSVQTESAQHWRHARHGATQQGRCNDSTACWVMESTWMK